MLLLLLQLLLLLILVVLLLLLQRRTRSLGDKGCHTAASLSSVETEPLAAAAAAA